MQYSYCDLIEFTHRRDMGDLRKQQFLTPGLTTSTLLGNSALATVTGKQTWGLGGAPTHLSRL